MTYLDSNILLYFILVKDVQKEHKEKAKSIINQSLKNDELVISFLTMTETFFVLAKKIKNN
jgi:predicted nucleic acid-binding protein